jgi:hypothetical protein
MWLFDWLMRDARVRKEGDQIVIGVMLCQIQGSFSRISAAAVQQHSHAGFVENDEKCHKPVHPGLELLLQVIGDWHNPTSIVTQSAFPSHLLHMGKFQCLTHANCVSSDAGDELVPSA